MTNYPRFYVLIYAGLIPFLACWGLLALGVQEIPFFGTVQHIFSLYMLVIASFMAGTYWGQGLTQYETGLSIPVFLLSNIVTIGLWLGYLLLSFLGFLFAGLCAFLFYLWLDFKFYQSGEGKRSYLLIRAIVTVIVCISIVGVGLVV